jgi:hypothetical protein
MMFHFDDGKLMLTQYDESGNSTSLVADFIEPAFADDVDAPDSSRERDGIGIRFSLPRATNHALSDDEYLHDVIVLVRKDGAHTIWRFYRDGAPTRGVFVELTQKDAPRALADSRSKGN